MDSTMKNPAMAQAMPLFRFLPDPSKSHAKAKPERVLKLKSIKKLKGVTSRISRKTGMVSNNHG
jgi:hypothetical protein